jgi:hypothetical protein
MEHLLKMPSQYVDQVMYPIKAQQQKQRHRSSLAPTREKPRQLSTEQQQQQQQQHLRSTITPTTQSTTSASNES